MERTKKLANVNLISVSLVDDAGRTGSLTLPVPTGLTVAQIQSYVTAMLPNLDAVTGAKINGCTVALQLTLPGTLKASAIADHPISYGANFGFDAADTNYRHTVRLPAIDQGLVDAGEVQTTDALIIAWTDDVVDGDATVLPCDRYGNDLSAFLGAEVTFRK